jgi:hypothetical protein
VIRVSFAASASSADFVRNVTPSGCSPILAKIFWELSLSVLFRNFCRDLCRNGCQLENWGLICVWHKLFGRVDPSITHDIQLDVEIALPLFVWIDRSLNLIVVKVVEPDVKPEQQKGATFILVVQIEEHIIHNWLLLFCHFCISFQYFGRRLIFLGLSSQALDAFRQLFFGLFLFDIWFDICFDVWNHNFFNEWNLDCSFAQTEDYWLRFRCF